MLDQFLGAILLLFGFQLGGSVRGESTPSAVTKNSSPSSHLKPLVRNDMASIEKKFLEKREKARLNWENKHASFAATLALIKDEKKKARVELLQNRLTEINTNQTTMLMGTVKRLDVGVGELYKIAQEYGVESGKDMSGVSSSIETASKAVADAATKVTAQAEKTYVITVTSETNLKTDFEKSREALAKDLKGVRDSVQNARKKVGDALKAVKNATGKSMKIYIQTEEIPVTPSVSP